MAGKIEGPKIKKIIEMFEGKYKIESSLSCAKSGCIKSALPKNSKNPDDNGIYEPDVILRKNNDIEAIIEIETDPVRKTLVGACIMADYCIETDQPGEKAKLFFIIGDPRSKSGKEGLKQFPDFEKREVIAKQYVKNVCIDFIRGDNEWMKELKKKMNL